MGARFIAIAALLLASGCEFPDFGDPDIPEVPTTSYCNGVAAWPTDWVDYEAEVLRIVNERRAQGANCGSAGAFGPAPALKADSALMCAARVHSQDMADRNYFSHTNPDGESPFTRMERAGYTAAGGENIAAGQQTPSQVMDGWMGSDGHCANIMKANYTEIGIGYHDARLWTQTFGFE